MMLRIRICKKNKFITHIIRKLLNVEMCECANIKPTLPKFTYLTLPTLLISMRLRLLTLIKQDIQDQQQIISLYYNIYSACH